LGLLIPTFSFSSGVCGLSFLRFTSDKATWKVLNEILLFLIFLFSTSAWGHWNSKCASTIGFGAAVAAWFFIVFIVLAINILLVPGSGGASGVDLGKHSSTTEEPVRASAETV
jgi:hypothetical protein